MSCSRLVLSSEVETSCGSEHSSPIMRRNGEGLHPFTEAVSNHQNVSITIRSRVTHVQDVHIITIPTMTGGNIPQGMVSSDRRFPLDTKDKLFEPFLDIIRHARPIEAMRQPG